MSADSLSVSAAAVAGMRALIQSYKHATKAAQRFGATMERMQDWQRRRLQRQMIAKAHGKRWKAIR